MYDYITPIDQWIIDDPLGISVLMLIILVWTSITIYLIDKNDQRKEEIRRLKFELWKERRKNKYK